jgi:antitoxin (DNA-binding transcriptional repressor) of toxin-antitoxin stability system
MKATILDLRYRMKDVLAALERGETITVLHQGKAKARLVPIRAGSAVDELRGLEAFGLWKDREDLTDVSGFVRKLRQPRDLRH